MERLRKKDYLTHEQVGGVYQYWPKVPQRYLLRRLFKTFVDAALGVSVSRSVAYLATGGQEMEQLKQLVRDLEQSPVGGGK